MVVVNRMEFSFYSLSYRHLVEDVVRGGSGGCKEQFLGGLEVGRRQMKALREDSVVFFFPT